MTRLAELWERFWFREASLVRLALFRMLVMVLCLADLIAYSRTNLRDAAAVSAGTIGKPWNPIYLFEVLGLGPPDAATARLVLLVGLVAVVCAGAGLLSRISCALAAVVVLYWTGVNYSFGKVHHDKVALAFTLLALPWAPVGARWSLDAALRARWDRWRGRARALPSVHRLAAVPLLLTQVSVALGYGFAGGTKLAVRGLDWANGYTLMGILMHYSTEWSWVLSHDLGLCRLASLGTLVVQTSFPLVLVFPRLRWFYLPSAVVFHLATWKTMDTGPYMTLWFLFVAFLPLEDILPWLRAKLRSGSWVSALAALTTVLLPTALVVRILAFYLPGWILVPSLAALVLAARRAPRSDEPHPARGGDLRACVGPPDPSTR